MLRVDDLQCWEIFVEACFLVFSIRNFRSRQTLLEILDNFLLLKVNEIPIAKGPFQLEIYELINRSDTGIFTICMEFMNKV